MAESDKSQSEEESKKDDEAAERQAPSGEVVYHAIVREADEELERSSSALFWSGLAAGLSMGASLIVEGILRHHLPDAEWAPLISKLGYGVGFVIVILGRQQLFTENTLTPMLPLMKRKDADTLCHVLRLWGIVLLSNLLGALAMGYVFARTPALESGVRTAFIEIGRETTANGFGVTLLRGVFAGWLIALLVWMLPYAEGARFFVIVFITWIVGIGHFNHIVIGAIEGFTLAWAGEIGWLDLLGRNLLPTLIGNILGGVTLVAALNHAQVVSGEA